MVDREVLAETIQRFWQGPTGRSWVKCCEQFPKQAEWFRQLADEVIKVNENAE